MKTELIAAAVALASVANAQTVSVKSPDGLNELRLDTEPVLSYSVYRGGVERIASTPLALELEGKAAFGGAATKIAAIENASDKGMLATPIYKKSAIDLTANRTVVAFDGGWKLALVARNDGVAYRFETDLADSVKVTNEVAGIVFPSGDLTAYAGYCRNRKDPLQSSWESIYVTTNTALLATNDDTVYLPLVVKYPDGGAMCVTEADLRDYPGWNMKRVAGEKPALGAYMAKYPTKVMNRDWKLGESETKRMRYLTVKERGDYLAETSGKRTYPWRVFMLAANEAKLCEADIVYALSKPCQLKSTDWIKPGKVSWDWWNCWNITGVDFKAGINTRTYEHFIDFAAEYGIEYVIMDEGWSKALNIDEFNPDTDVPHIVKYANARGVGIILWCAWPQLIGRQEEVFTKFANMGVKGFKIDFMDRDDQLLEQYLEETSRIAAEHKLVIDWHGMHKPTGLSRAYPNVLNYEGVHGLECMKWENGTDFMRNDLMSFYCRMSAGPMDYTPGAMRNMTKEGYRASRSQPGSQGTRVHQMALMSMYEAPLQMLSDSPSLYRKNAECFKFMAEVPVTWDETIGLAGSMEDFAVIARRKGEVWYVSAICSWTPRTTEIGTAFLGEGKWKVEIFADGMNADREATDYVHNKVTITAGEKMKFDMAPGGGWTAKFVKKGLFW